MANDSFFSFRVRPPCSRFSPDRPPVATAALLFSQSDDESLGFDPRTLVSYTISGGIGFEPPEVLLQAVVYARGDGPACVMPPTEGEDDDEGKRPGGVVVVKCVVTRSGRYGQPFFVFARTQWYHTRFTVQSMTPRLWNHSR